MQKKEMEKNEESKLFYIWYALKGFLMRALSRACRTCWSEPCWRNHIVAKTEATM